MPWTRERKGDPVELTHPGIKVGRRNRLWALLAKFRHRRCRRSRWPSRRRPVDTRPGGRHRAGARAGQVTYPFHRP